MLKTVLKKNWACKSLLLLGSYLLLNSVVYATGIKESRAFLNSYSSIAYESYKSAFADARQLQRSIQNFVKNPTQDRFDSVKTRWLMARESYGQTEAFRLQEGPIDAESGWVSEKYGALEGQLNAWPLDENLIDYTVDENGLITRGNIIDTEGVFTPSGVDKGVDVTRLSADNLTQLNEYGSDANVTTGYHAVEFLLWGQDQDYNNFINDDVTNGALQAGNRPLSDFTTDQYAQRRQAYLQLVGQKIVNDLWVMVKAWAPYINDNYRAALLGKHPNKNYNIGHTQALKTIFSGMGVYIKSELANERLAVALLTPSEEDEHSCFSDNTHRDIIQNYQGFKNILTGNYEGTVYGDNLLKRYSLNSINRLMFKIERRLQQMDLIARTSRHFDYQIRPSDPQVRELNRLKRDLRKLGDKMLAVAKAFDIDLTVDDVTDAEETQLQ